jgi:aminoglycoside 3-N-acetyltransferase
MTEHDAVSKSPIPLTVDTLAEQFAACGLRAGMSVLLHSSLSNIGWVIGGAQAVVEALLHVLTPDGTLMVPAHTTDNSDPAYWQNPPVPEAWWQTIRDNMPAYDPLLTPTRKMGRIADTVRAHPDAKRSDHPALSFAAVGKQRDFLVENQSLDYPLGENSPLARLYDLDGYVMLLGVDHDSNTSLHLAEYRSGWGRRHTTVQGAAMMVNSQRQWVTYQDIDVDSSDFVELGRDYEREAKFSPQRVGLADVRLLRQRPLVDYAANWIEKNRR